MSTVIFRTPLRPTFLRLLSLAAMILTGSVIAPEAHAQWAVHDKANDTLNTTMGGTTDGNSVNDNLNAIRKKLMISDYTNGRPGDRVKDPASTIPTDTTRLIPTGDKRCDALPDPQQTNCNKIVEIQNAQYQYMLTMYANSKTRNDMLQAIIADRKSIKADDPNALGKIEENTNQLTALYNLIALDQAQMQSVNYAYEANLRFLREEQGRLARAANSGKTADKPSPFTIPLPGGGDLDIGKALPSIAAGAALKLALDGVQSDKPSGIQTLSISQSNGW